MSADSHDPSPAGSGRGGRNDRHPIRCAILAGELSGDGWRRHIPRRCQPAADRGPQRCRRPRRRGDSRGAFAERRRVARAGGGVPPGRADRGRQRTFGRDQPGGVAAGPAMSEQGGGGAADRTSSTSGSPGSTGGQSSQPGSSNGATTNQAPPHGSSSASKPGQPSVPGGAPSSNGNQPTSAPPGGQRTPGVCGATGLRHGAVVVRLGDAANLCRIVGQRHLAGVGDAHQHPLRRCRSVRQRRQRLCGDRRSERRRR